MFNDDISPKFKYNPMDAKIGSQLIQLEETPKAIQYFEKVCDKLTDYGYWFFLSNLWVSYTGLSELDLWKKLFSAKRKDRFSCIMKPSEIKAFNDLSNNILAYRVHRQNESDWIAYTLSLDVAKRFAKERNVSEISQYRIRKKEIIALFLRRGEHEIIVLDKNKVKFIDKIFV